MTDLNAMRHRAERALELRMGDIPCATVYEVIAAFEYIDELEISLAEARATISDFVTTTLKQTVTVAHEVGRMAEEMLPKE